jgi:hypothetical protein
MARGKAINVKIATPKVITALTTRLAELEANYKKQDENEAKYQDLYSAWKKELFAFAITKIDRLKMCEPTIVNGQTTLMLILI